MVTVTSLSIGVVCCALTGNQNSDYGFKSITFAGLVLSKYIALCGLKPASGSRISPTKAKLRPRYQVF